MRRNPADQLSRNERPFLLGGSLLVVGQAINLLLRGLFDAPASNVVCVLIVAGFATWHGVLRYGFARVFAFGIAVTVISCSFETASMLTGFPSDPYHYTEKFGPRIGMVPLAVPPVYFAMGYVSWAVAHALLSVHDGVLAGARLITVPVAAAVLMVLWCLPIDPLNATIGGYWVWHAGGPFFGVPLNNFSGWLLLVGTFFLIFALINRVSPREAVPLIVERRFYWLLPVGMYCSFTLDYLGAAVGRDNVLVTTMDGHSWWTGDIYGSMALIALFTSIPIGLNAVYRILRDLPASGAAR